MGKSHSTVVPLGDAAPVEHESRLQAMRLIMRNEVSQELFQTFVLSKRKSDFLYFYEELETIKELTSFFIHKQQQIIELINSCLQSIDEVHSSKGSRDKILRAALMDCFDPLSHAAASDDITFQTVVKAIKLTEDNLLSNLFIEFDEFIHSKTFQKMEKEIHEAPTRRISMDIGKVSSGSIRTTASSVASNISRNSNMQKHSIHS
jgi:hypothetical protein